LIYVSDSMTGFHKTSVAYLSPGVRRFNQPFEPTPYGVPFIQGDVIGVGYRPRTGTIFFTRNGKKFEDVGHGLKAQNFFPAIGANGPATIHVNLGQNGFNFIEANVKKWGLAPVTGSLAPPPPYGSEQGSILLESGTKGGGGYPQQQRAHANTHSGVHPYRANGSQTLNPQHGRSRSGTFRVMPPTSPGPQRSSTDISLAQLVPTEEEAGPSGAGGGEGEANDTVSLGIQDALNPPPDYSSPENSSTASRRTSVDSENTPLIQIVNRSRQSSSATGSDHPPIPTYSDAIAADPPEGVSRSTTPGDIV
jgi:hypothetical protein